MPLKRASRGRRKGGKGRSGNVQCDNCGRNVPKDKAKKISTRINLVDHQLARELREQGAYIPTSIVTKTFCISCGIHFKVLKIRSEDERRNNDKLR